MPDTLHAAGGGPLEQMRPHPVPPPRRCRRRETAQDHLVGQTIGLEAVAPRLALALAILELSDPARRGTTTAFACGYADQAHFIRDFRKLAGCPPGEHLLRQGDMTGFFVRRSDRAGVSTL